MGAPLALNEFRLKIQKSAALTNNFFFLFFLAGKKRPKTKSLADFSKTQLNFYSKNPGFLN
jgi:hypothetical protein